MKAVWTPPGETVGGASDNVLADNSLGRGPTEKIFQYFKQGPWKQQVQKSDRLDSDSRFVQARGNITCGGVLGFTRAFESEGAMRAALSALRTELKGNGTLTLTWTDNSTTTLSQCAYETITPQGDVVPLRYLIEIAFEAESEEWST